jgi:hypothetical protein
MIDSSLPPVTLIWVTLSDFFLHISGLGIFQFILSNDFLRNSSIKQCDPSILQHRNGSGGFYYKKSISFHNLTQKIKQKLENNG